MRTFGDFYEAFGRGRGRGGRGLGRGLGRGCGVRTRRDIDKCPYGNPKDPVGGMGPIRDDEVSGDGRDS